MRSVRSLRILDSIPILVRAALNVPVANGVVTNDYRLRRAVPTIRYLKEKGARVILISHIGDKGTETLEPVAKALGKLIPGVSFSKETIGPGVRATIRAMKGGDVLVLENLRRHAGETKNSAEFAKELAALADVFVQDSFDTCHRPHASIVGVPKLLPSYAGLLLEEEDRELSAALAPKAPSLAVIGGAKFGTKEPVLAALLKRYSRVFVGGALANDFFRAQGIAIGKSLVSAADPARARALLSDKKLSLPADVRAAVSGKAASARTAPIYDIHPEESVLDVGPQTERLMKDLARAAKTILWNGPLGNYENGFTEATDSFARAAAESGARTIVGGGDTIAAIERLGILPRFSFVSTGGGAMLEYLAQGTLPGIEALGH